MLEQRRIRRESLYNLEDSERDYTDEAKEIEFVTGQKSLS